jgi:hypothetical protein
VIDPPSPAEAGFGAASKVGDKVIDEVIDKVCDKVADSAPEEEAVEARVEDGGGLEEGGGLAPRQIHVDEPLMDAD